MRSLKLSLSNLHLLGACIGGIAFAKRAGIIDYTITEEQVDKLREIMNKSHNEHSCIVFLLDVFDNGFTCDEQGRIVSYDTNYKVVYDNDLAYLYDLDDELIFTYNEKLGISTDSVGDYNLEFGRYDVYEHTKIGKFSLIKSTNYGETYTIYYNGFKIDSIRSNLVDFSRSTPNCIYAGLTTITLSESGNTVVVHKVGDVTPTIIDVEYKDVILDEQGRLIKIINFNDEYDLSGLWE